MKTLLEFLEENRSNLRNDIYSCEFDGEVLNSKRHICDAPVMRTTHRYSINGGVISLIEDDIKTHKTASDYLKDGADLLSERGKQYDKPKNKYDRQCKGVTIDVYDVLKAFDVTDPALQHLIKKALCAGLRGHKNKEQDLQDIIDSANRAMELYHDDNGSAE